MTIIESIILGILQGLTEFLPVSSSGHLLLARRIMGIEAELVLFDLVLHLATLLAVVTVLKKPILDLIKKPFGKRAQMLVVASLPAISVYVLFDDFVERALSGAYLGFGFIFTALLLLVSDIVSVQMAKPTHQGNKPSLKGAGQKKIKTIEGSENKISLKSAYPKGKTEENRGENKIGLKNALIMGTAQGAAILPAISRSGSTLCAALILGVEREEAAEFSFLMSIPMILGGVALKGVESIKTPLAYAPSALVVLCGFAAAAIFGLLSVKFMLRIIKTHRLWGFSVYLAIVGIASFFI